MGSLGGWRLSPRFYRIKNTLVMPRESRASSPRDAMDERERAEARSLLHHADGFRGR